MDKNYSKGFTLADFVDPEIREILENNKLLDPTTIRKNFSYSARIAINQFHLLTCSDPGCTFHIEDSMENTWMLQEHIETADKFLKLMNDTEMTLGKWEQVRTSIVKIMKLLLNDQVTTEVFKILTKDYNLLCDNPNPPQVS